MSRLYRFAFCACFALGVWHILSFLQLLPQ
jgi:hypothetical protein